MVFFSTFALTLTKALPQSVVFSVLPLFLPKPYHKGVLRIINFLG